MDLLSNIANRPEPLHVLMCTPDFYKIVDVKNVHMLGNTGNVDPTLFKKQWQDILNIYQAEVIAGNIDGVSKITGIRGCEDMVFCANQSFPWLFEDDSPFAILSRMKYPSRQNEVPYFEEYYDALGYELYDAPGDGLLEGMGDLIPMPGKNLVFGGYGHRTDFNTLDLVSEILGCPIIPLELINDSFYHLDTCFIPLNVDTALIAPEAFTNEGNAEIKRYFKEVIEIPFAEASKGFSLNAHAVNGHQYSFAIIQKNNPVTKDIFIQKGYKVYEVETSEFMKSGGSVFCMKMMHY